MELSVAVGTNQTALYLNMIRFIGLLVSIHQRFLSNSGKPEL